MSKVAWQLEYQLRILTVSIRTNLLLTSLVKSFRNIVRHLVPRPELENDVLVFYGRWCSNRDVTGVPALAPDPLCLLASTTLMVMTALCADHT